VLFSKIIIKENEGTKKIINTGTSHDSPQGLEKYKGT
jgi:hypothetical protein